MTKTNSNQMKDSVFTLTIFGMIILLFLIYDGDELKNCRMENKLLNKRIELMEVRDSLNNQIIKIYQNRNLTPTKQWK